jgi:hypothetical protein
MSLDPHEAPHNIEKHVDRRELHKPPMLLILLPIVLVVLLAAFAR